MENENQIIDPAVAELAALKAQLADTAVTVLAGVPENLRALIPANLPADQVAWFHTAKATGVFDAKPAIPATDSGKPAITPTTPDPATMPVYARMAGGYRK